MRNVCGSEDASLDDSFLCVQTEAPSEEGAETWCDTEEFPNSTDQTSISYSKKQPEFTARCQW